METLQVCDISKSFEGQPLLEGVSFAIRSGEIACLLGPSGSGKTTLLRIIAGLEKAESGQVEFEGAVIDQVPPHLRGFGLMFQDLALFPHRNVFENVAFGLKMQNMPGRAIAERVTESLNLVGLAGFAKRDVNLLSGGEQQRVALARALAPRPRFLMFDEPLGALDRILREQLVVDLRKILKQMGQTSLYVTHDQNEAFSIADRVLVIYNGTILQSDAPRQLYEHPANPYIARFLGLNNFIPGRVIEATDNHGRVETPFGTLIVAGSVPPLDTQVLVLVRPEAALSISDRSTGDSENSVSGRVVETRFQVGKPQITLDVGNYIKLALEWAEDLQIGKDVTVRLDPHKLPLYKRGDDEAE